MVFGTVGECCTNVKEVLEIAVEYGVEHLGRIMAATTVDTVRIALGRRFSMGLSTTALKGVRQFDPR